MNQPLEAVLEEINQEEQETAFQPFAVTDLETAAEAQRRIAYFEEQKNDINSIIEQQIAPFLAKIKKIKDWGEQAKQEFDEKQKYYAGQLEIYLREEVKKKVESGKNPKKTVKLPYGKISLKAQQPEFKRDENLLLPHAKQLGFIKTKEETDWSELKKVCKVEKGKLYDPNGELVPGVTVVERDEKFEIKLD
ncbi:hypothetical protein BKM15_26180 [Pseudomonas syringae pv. syringae]|nr:hypothetical protein BKM15_26180 [Pseudomonas syringae pv. syringae]